MKHLLIDRYIRQYTNKYYKSLYSDELYIKQSLYAKLYEDDIIKANFIYEYYKNILKSKSKSLMIDDMLQFYQMFGKYKSFDDDLNIILVQKNIIQILNWIKSKIKSNPIQNYCSNISFQIVVYKNYSIITKWLMHNCYKCLNINNLKIFIRNYSFRHYIEHSLCNESYNIIIEYRAKIIRRNFHIMTRIENIECITGKFGENITGKIDLPPRNYHDHDDDYDDGDY